MAKCMNCGNKACFEGLCKGCFDRQIEKRIRKYLRISKAFSKGDILLVQDPLSEYFVKSVIQDAPIKIVKKGKHTIKVLPWTIDDESADFLGYFMKGTIRKKEQGIVKLFKAVRDEELEAFAKMKDLPFKRKEHRLKAFLDKLEKEHKETKFSLLKSIDEIENMLNA